LILTTDTNHLKLKKMANTNKLNISWKNSLWQSIGEQDVIKLRNQLKIIKSKYESKMTDYKIETIVREITM
jgi:hypothetical protein